MTKRISIKKYLVISDLQIPYHHEAAVKNVIKLARREKFDSVLNVGDEIDFQTISRWAEKTPLAYEQTLHRDRELTQSILWDLTENAKEAHIVRSNHTDRLYNTLLKVPGLISLPELQYDKFMDFATMGIQFHKTFYEFEKGWILAHGDEGNTNPNPGITALNLAKKAGKSVVCGHTHKLGLSAYTEGLGANYRTIWGIEAGNLMNKSKASYTKGIANWAMGIVILDWDGKNMTPTLIPINKDGSFTALGKSYV
jgi:predicted phosphodiesterase